MNEARLSAQDRALLASLLRMPTAGPLVTGGAGPAPQLWEAQRSYAAAAAELGFDTVWHAPVPTEATLRNDVPMIVRRAVAEQPGFLDLQPSLVLRLGPELPRSHTIMFNVHLDTVAGMEPVDFDGLRWTGRGAIDAKGPAVALLAGLRAAVAADSSIGSEAGVLVQAVAGQEGGAVGTIGTRALIEEGFVGRLNVFCEPTDLRYLPRATAVLAAGVRVVGRDAIEGRPEAGHNATVLLGFLAQHLGAVLPLRIPDGQVCIAGLHTGLLPNRVYGSGELLLNLVYAAPISSTELEIIVLAAVRDGIAEFRARFGSIREFARTAAEATAVTRLEWYQRGLPTLAGSDAWGEAVLRDDAGLSRWPTNEPAFTSAAIWMHGVPGAFTVILGPGSPETNKAGTRGEHAEVAELESFAAAVARIVLGFARRRRFGVSLDETQPGMVNPSSNNGVLRSG